LGLAQALTRRVERRRRCSRGRLRRFSRSQGSLGRQISSEADGKERRSTHSLSCPPCGCLLLLPSLRGEPEHALSAFIPYSLSFRLLTTILPPRSFILRSLRSNPTLFSSLRQDCRLSTRSLYDRPIFFSSFSHSFVALRAKLHHQLRVVRLFLREGLKQQILR
jgi:hypothetical protein